MSFEFWQCAEEDQRLFEKLIGSLEREPDLVIADDIGTPYLYRWHVIPRNQKCNIYAHVQVASDPARPLHDHPWDNTSHILAGGYFEQISMYPADGTFKPHVFKYVPGQLIYRQAHYAHRLILPENVAYTMTLFTTGPKIQNWGFWIDGKKVLSTEVCRMEGNASLWIGPKLDLEAAHGPYRL